jgi:predicted transcriptional regulator
MDKLREVIRQNDTAPDIPLVKAVEQAFPQFHSQAVQYYRSHSHLRRTAKSAQVLSSASVQIALSPFSKGWAALERAVDLYASFHPHPHAQEITTKFHSIQSSLDIVSRANANRKFPNIAISKSVLAIRALCHSLDDSIMSLFSEPQFPHFQTDHLRIYRADVKGFLMVVKEAFRNEFPQCGLATQELARIESKVLSACSDILAGLSAAFSFLPLMEEIQGMKNSYNNATGDIITCFAQPFNIVRPRHPEEATAIEVPKDSPEERAIRAQQKEEADGWFRRMDPKRKVELFLFDVVPLLGMELRTIDSPWATLDVVRTKIKGIVEASHANATAAHEMRAKVADLMHDLEVARESRVDPVDYANDVTKKFAREIRELKDQLKRADRSFSELNAVVCQQQERLEHLSEFESSIEKIRQILSEFGAPQSDVIAQIRQLLGDLRSRNSTLCKNEAEFRSMAKEIKNLLGLDASANFSEVVTAIESLGSSAHISHISSSDLPIAPPPRPRVKINKGNIEELLRQQLSDIQIRYLKDLQTIAERLQDFTGGTLEHAVETDEQLSIIDRQFAAVRGIIRALLDNDQQTRSDLAATRSELRRWIDGIAGAVGSGEKPLETAIGIITGTQNPLHCKLLELSAELRLRDQQTKTILVRVSGIRKLQVEPGDGCAQPGPYYEVKKSPIPSQILGALQSIQDETESIQRRNVELERQCAQLLDALNLMEARLRKTSNGDVRNEVTDDVLIERINKFLDVVMSQSFSEQFMRVSDINALFRECRPDSITQPGEYLPVFLRKYCEMDRAIASSRKFTQVLDVILRSMNGPMDNEFVQQHVNELHANLQKLDQSMLVMPVFTVISRFVALVQTLVSQIGTLTGRTIRVASQHS